MKSAYNTTAYYNGHPWDARCYLFPNHFSVYMLRKGGNKEGRWRKALKSILFSCESTIIFTVHLQAQFNGHQSFCPFDRIRCGIKHKRNIFANFLKTKGFKALICSCCWRFWRCIDLIKHVKHCYSLLTWAEDEAPRSFYRHVKLSQLGNDNQPCWQLYKRRTVQVLLSDMVH